MRVFLTGGTGFLGWHIARLLRERGDEVVALARATSKEKRQRLRDIGCEVVEGDLTNTSALQQVMRGAQACLHIAGNYAVGIPPGECAEMMDVNAGGTEHVLNAAIAADIGRIVYASSIISFGNTNGRIVDETYKRDLGDGFLSCYDESKFRAHEIATAKVAEGAPVIIMCPGSLYGPGDHSEVGRQIVQAATGKLPALMLVDVGLTMVHVEDCAKGFISALDNGVIGESYVLGGPTVRLRDVLETSAELAGRRLTRRSVPTSLLKAITPVAPRILPRMGYPPNLGELISTTDNVTYWADDTKARNELGWTTRSFEQGLRETLEANGIPLP